MHTYLQYSHHFFSPDWHVDWLRYLGTIERMCTACTCIKLAPNVLHKIRAPIVPNAVFVDSMGQTGITVTALACLRSAYCKYRHWNSRWNSITRVWRHKAFLCWHLYNKPTFIKADYMDLSNLICGFSNLWVRANLIVAALRLHVDVFYRSLKIFEAVFTQLLNLLAALTTASVQSKYAEDAATKVSVKSTA